MTFCIHIYYHLHISLSHKMAFPFLIFAHELILGNLGWRGKQDILNINKHNNFYFIYWILLCSSVNLNFCVDFTYFVNLLSSISFCCSVNDIFSSITIIFVISQSRIFLLLQYFVRFDFLGGILCM